MVSKGGSVAVGAATLHQNFQRPLVSIHADSRIPIRTGSAFFGSMEFDLFFYIYLSEYRFSIVLLFTFFFFYMLSVWHTDEMFLERCSADCKWAVK